MPNRNILLPLILLQILPLLIFPPETLQGSLALIGVAALVFIGLGIGIWRGRGWALSLSIFVQGFNAIIRLMMLFPNAVARDGSVDLPFITTSLLAILLSIWFLLRLDRPDVRSLIIA
jgi:hypothetical protein